MGDLGDSTFARTQQTNIWRVIGMAWSDESFKRELLSDPNGVLEAHGVEIQPGVKVSILEEDDATNYIVIPKRPADVQLTDFQGDDVATCWSYNVITSF